LKLIVEGKTDRGIIRENNEDNFCILEKQPLYMVADGMGGHASGEIASKIAIDIIRDYFNNPDASRQLQIGEYREDYSEATNRLGSAIRLANQAIYEAARTNPLWQGMGTTIVAAFLNGKRLSIAHVGDSRIYLIRLGDIEQLTDDHSLVSEQVKREMITKEQARESKMKNVLTRALGVAPDVKVDLDELSLMQGDVLLLCSDGLTTMVPDEDILSVVTSTTDPAIACEQLISLANENGGEDNITVITAYIKKESWFSSLFNVKKWFRR